ncbi:MAG: hypothetical protein NT003_04625 [Candidatus Magasanikbacteria bacterium]|nr:hypothetical protein [Candidatus Magasanikbacteria bacterium]
MANFPFYYILFAYLIFLAIFFIFSFANISHLYATGTFTLPAFAVTSIVSIWCVLILGATLVSLANVNWNTTVVLLGPAGFVTFQ